MILLLGGSGMLGSALARRLAADSREFVATSRDRLDLMLPESIAPALEEIAPDAVINAAGFNPSAFMDDRNNGKQWDGSTHIAPEQQQKD